MNKTMCSVCYTVADNNAITCGADICLDILLSVSLSPKILYGVTVPKHAKNIWNGLRNGKRSSSVARELGISKQYACQIQQKLGIKSSVQYRKSHNMQNHCSKCSSLFTPNKFVTLCDNCGHSRKERVSLICFTCEINFQKQGSQYEHSLKIRKADCKDKWFHSKSCYGKYFGKHHGFKRSM